MKKELTKRQISNIQNRKRIIETSKELFYKYSFEETTMADIARESGLSNGTIYNLYENKAAILYEIYDRYVNIPLNLTDDLATKISNPVDFLIKAYIESFKLWMKVGWSVSANCYKMAYDHEDFPNSSLDIYIKNDICEYIKYAQEVGSITNEYSSKVIEDILSSQIRGILYNWHMRKGDYDMISVVEEQLEIILKLIVVE